MARSRPLKVGPPEVAFHMCSGKARRGTPRQTKPSHAQEVDPSIVVDVLPVDSVISGIATGGRTSLVFWVSLFLWAWDLPVFAKCLAHKSPPKSQAHTSTPNLNDSLPPNHEASGPSKNLLCCHMAGPQRTRLRGLAQSFSRGSCHVARLRLVFPHPSDAPSCAHKPSCLPEP